MSQQLDDIVSRMRASIQSMAALMEGSFTMDNLRAVGQEFLLCYLAIERLEDNWSLDTAKGGFLDRKALDYGIDRKDADYGKGYVRFNGTVGAVIPYRTLVADESGVQYKVMAEAVIGAGGYADAFCQAEITGPIGNAERGTVKTIVSSIKGIVSCENLSDFEGGRNEESDISLRTRIYEKIRNPITSGNVNSYRQWALSFDEVGAVKVFPLWQGAGTVKVSILTSDLKPASLELVTRVQAYIDPTNGDGSGQAPVGAIVTVSTAEAKQVNVSAKVQIGAASMIEHVQEQFKAKLSEYFRLIAYDGSTKEFAVARAGFLLLGTDGIFDYVDLTLNSGTSAIAIGDEEILQVGEISLTAR